MTRRFFDWHWDSVGFGVSLLCAFHCMLLPLILTLGIFAGAHWLMNPLGEWIFTGTSIVIASWSLLRSYSNKHRNVIPLLIATLGFLGLFLAQTIIVSNKHGLMAIAGGLIAYAHYYNWQLMHQPKQSVKGTRPWFAPGRIAAILLLLLYFLGLHSVFVKENTPPSREELLQVVWRGQD